MLAHFWPVRKPPPPRPRRPERTISFTVCPGPSRLARARPSPPPARRYSSRDATGGSTSRNGSSAVPPAPASTRTDVARALTDGRAGLDRDHPHPARIALRTLGERPRRGHQGVVLVEELCDAAASARTASDEIVGCPSVTAASAHQPIALDGLRRVVVVSTTASGLACETH